MTRKKKIEIQVKTPKYAEKTRYANAFISNIDIENSFARIVFGEIVDKDEIRLVTEKTKIAFPVELLENIVAELFELGVKYQKETGIDIGFPRKDDTK